jgi:hypothetical protein
MDFSEAIAFSRKFSFCRPRVFKAFVEWGIWDNQTDGYVVILTDLVKTKDSDVKEMYDYIESHHLKLDSFNDYFLISTNC